MESSLSDLSALVTLLKESDLGSSVGGGGDATSSGPVRPLEPAKTGSVFKVGGLTVGPAATSGAAAPPPAGFDAQSIWAPEEVVSLHEAMAAPSACDTRKRPHFDYGFKQRVGSEDVFLGLSGTTESSVHCDTLVMRILLPGERLADIDLDCTEERIVVSASQHKLSTFLPSRVFSRSAVAKWDADKSALLISFPLDKSGSLMDGVGGSSSSSSSTL